MKSARFQRWALRLVVVAAVVLMATLLPAAQVGEPAPTEPKQLEKFLNKLHKGGVSQFKIPYASERLSFDLDGNLVGRSDIGPWTLYSRFQIEKIKVRDDHFEIFGRRVFVRFANGTRTMRQVTSGSKVHIRLAARPEARTEADFNLALVRVLVASNEEAARTAPEYWQPFLLGQTPWAPDLVPPRLAISGSDVVLAEASLPEGVEPPQCISCPRPITPPVADSLGGYGVFVFELDVSAAGEIERWRVLKPLGLDVEEAFAAKFPEWKTEPARRDGQPIPYRWTRIFLVERHRPGKY